MKDVIIMTREEEIKKAKEIFYASSDDYTFYNKSFEEGAKWADEHPYSNGKELLYVAHKTAERTKKEIIINACDWLDNINTDDYMDSGIFQMSDLISDFKKAMKELL